MLIPMLTRFLGVPWDPSLTMVSAPVVGIGMPTLVVEKKSKLAVFCIYISFFLVIPGLWLSCSNKASFLFFFKLFIFLFGCLEAGQSIAAHFHSSQWSGFDRGVSLPHSRHEMPKGESSSWAVRSLHQINRNMLQILMYCSTRPQHALDSWVGQKKSVAKHAWIKWKPFLGGSAGGKEQE